MADANGAAPKARARVETRKREQESTARAAAAAAERASTAKDDFLAAVHSEFGEEKGARLSRS